MKKFYFSKIILCLILSVTLALSGCSSPTNNNTKEPTTEKSTLTVTESYKDYTDFKDFTEFMFRENVTKSSLNLHYTISTPSNYGINDYPVQIADFNLDSVKDTKQEIWNYIAKLKSFDYNTLTDEEQLTYDILIHDFELEYKYADMYLFNESLSPTIGDNAQIPVLLAEYYFKTETDITDYIKLLGTLGTYFDNLISFEKLKSEKGLFMSDECVDAIINQCKDFIAEPKNNYLIQVFNDRIDAFEGLDSEKITAYKAQNKAAVLDSVIPAYEALIKGLTDLKGTGKNETGLSGLEGGKEYYKYLVATKTGSSKSIEEIKDNISKQVAADLRAIVKISTTNPDIATDFEKAKFPSTQPKEILKDLQNKIKDDFPEGPATKYTVKYVNKSLEDNLSPAFYLTPPIDAIEDNVIYINGGAKFKDQNQYTTLAHEGYPGHLYQTTYFSSKNPMLIRNILNYPGYVEGWATYVEMMSYDYAGLDKDLAAAFKHNSSFSLGIYCLIDIGVNYEGWDLQKTTEFLAGYQIFDEDSIKEIFLAMVAEPANYLSYYVGYLEFMELQANAKEKAGDKFDLKDFHKQILEIGPAPFGIIADNLY